ncbi:MAG: hypothetical protein ISS57_06790 [Anaerolineales bacterium]|nr:hypothetical protein [Chloroflexota bacterium]MBL7162295.1 hypothetical protein [Anaerolineales bacterium]
MMKKVLLFLSQGFEEIEAAAFAVAFWLLEMLNGPEDVKKVKRAMRFGNQMMKTRMRTTFPDKK